MGFDYPPGTGCVNQNDLDPEEIKLLITSHFEMHFYDTKLTYKSMGVVLCNSITLLNRS